MLTAIVTAAALASPGSAGAVHIGAAALDPGKSWVGGGVVGTGSYGEAYAVPGLDAGTALGTRGALAVQTALIPTSEATIGTTVSGRHLFIDAPDFRFAGTGNAVLLLPTPGSTIDLWTGEEGHVMSWLAPGIAIEAGSESVFFDMAVPVWGLSSFNQYVGFARQPFPLAGTLGLNVRTGDHHRLRLGAPELLSWHVRTEDVYLDIGGFTLGSALSVFWMKVGALF